MVADGEQQLTYAEFVHSDRSVTAHRGGAAGRGDPKRAGHRDHRPRRRCARRGRRCDRRGKSRHLLTALIRPSVCGRFTRPPDGGSSSSDTAGVAVRPEIAGDQPVIVLNEQSDPAGDATPDDYTIDPERLAILFFTSGSTGVPKGVSQTTATPSLWPLRLLPLAPSHPGRRLGLVGSLSFSAAYNRVWAGLLNGVTLYCYDTSRDGVRGIPAWANANGVRSLASFRQSSEHSRPRRPTPA